MDFYSLCTLQLAYHAYVRTFRQSDDRNIWMRYKMYYLHISYYSCLLKFSQKISINSNENKNVMISEWVEVDHVDWASFGKTLFNLTMAWMKSSPYCFIYRIQRFLSLSWRKKCFKNANGVSYDFLINITKNKTKLNNNNNEEQLRVRNTRSNIPPALQKLYFFHFALYS